MRTIYDENGRPIEIWKVKDTLDWKYPYLPPLTPSPTVSTDALRTTVAVP